jgi:hypothetical protein
MFLAQPPTAWGSEPIARMIVRRLAPSLADDERFLQWMAKWSGL